MMRRGRPMNGYVIVNARGTVQTRTFERSASAAIDAMVAKDGIVWSHWDALGYKAVPCRVVPDLKDMRKSPRARNV